MTHEGGRGGREGGREGREGGREGDTATDGRYRQENVWYRLQLSTTKCILVLDCVFHVWIVIQGKVG